MEAEETAPAERTSRPRPLLLALLAAAVAAFLLTRSADPVVPGGPATRPGAGARPAPAAIIDPAQLDVQLDALARDRPGPSDTGRNPFRFQVRAPPAAQQTVPAPQPGSGPTGSEPAPVPAAAVRPITVRFIGVLERGGETFAIFVDCTEGRRTPYAREGEIVDGRYRLVRIGAESVVIEHLDGSGRTTLAQNGQECVR